VILLILVVTAALAVASYEMWRRGGPTGRERDPLETADPPPLIYDRDASGDGPDGGDAGDGGGDA
jgi:hypothetical protein